MPSIAVVAELSVAPVAAQGAWLDARRWPQWVDGLERVVSVSADWPAVGAEVIWGSVPAGRGRVEERLREDEPGTVITEVHDSSLTGHQILQLTETDDGGCQACLTLTYRLRRRNPVTLAIDLLFVRRAFTSSLARTLERFAAAVELF